MTKIINQKKSKINMRGKKEIPLDLKNPEYLLAIFRDQLIGQKNYKKKKRDFRERRKQYKDLWDNSPVAYHILDTEGKIIHANKAEARMLGHPRKEIIGRSIFDFILPRQRQEAEKRYKLKLEGMIVPKKENRIYVRKDGSRFYVSLDDVLEKNESGEVIGVRTTMTDITYRKKADDFAKRARKAEEHLLESYKHLGMMNRKIPILLELTDGHKKKGEITKYIATSAISLSGATFGALFLCDDEKIIHLLQEEGVGKEIKDFSFESVPALERLKKDKIRMQGVFSKKDLGHLNDFFKDYYLLLIPLIKRQGNRLKGILVLGFEDGKSIGSHDLVFFDVFAIHVSSALLSAGILK